MRSGRIAMTGLAFWLRWSWRDLRQRWLLVAAIALTIGIGTGAYAGLSSSSAWRQAGNDSSYAALRMFDVRVRITDGSTVPDGRLAEILSRIAHPEWIDQKSERLVLPTQVDASHDGTTILVPGQIIGVDVSDPATAIAGEVARVGRTLEPGDARRDIATLDYHFAHEKQLAPSGKIRISGGRTLTYVGQILTPEYFLVTTAAGGLLAEANFAAVVAPIDTVQRLTDNRGRVNDVILRVSPGVDVNAARDEVSAAMDRYLASEVDVETAADDEAHRILYDDIDTDQRFYSVFALVILAGATLAAFNLTSRIVESQRREFGISMALGLPRRWISFRPILVGGQVALLGVVLGVGVGTLIGIGMDNVLQRYFPLPVWSAPFQAGVFAQAAVIGFALPFVASLYPVWRAVRVPPIKAIRAGFLSATGTGWAPLAGRLRLPGGPLVQMPLRNILRAPRRTILTMLGIGAAVTVFVGTTGLTDTFLRTIDIGQQEVVKNLPNRLFVSFDSFLPQPLAVSSTRATGLAGEIEPQLALSGTARVNGIEQDLSIDLLDVQSARWLPTLVDGRLPAPVPTGSPPEIVLAKAGADVLRVHLGDVITVKHKTLHGTKLEDEDSQFQVSGLAIDPLKTSSYMDESAADVFGLRGRANRLSVVPEPGRQLADVQKALFKTPGVVSVDAVDTVAKIFRHIVDQYLNLLTIVQYTALALALLIAFNTATIALDERTRENATMFAFGTRIRSVLAMAVIESASIGILGTLIGLVGGRVVLEFIVHNVVRDVVPDIGFTITISDGTVVGAAILGVLVVGAAPLLGARRLVRLNVPNALRVVE